MTRVIVMPQFNGVADSVKWQIENIPAYAKPAEARVLHEPVSISEFDMVNNLNTGRYKPELVHERLQLKMRWGPSHSYIELYRFLQDNGYRLHPLDHSIFDRRALANGFAGLARKIGKEGRTEELVREYRMLKRRLYYDREKLFDEIIDECRYDNIGAAVVLVHPRHIPGIRNKLERDGYVHQIVHANEELEHGFRAAEKRVLTEAAKTVLEKELPPLMPAFYLASGLVHSASG